MTSRVSTGSAPIDLVGGPATYHGRAVTGGRQARARRRLAGLAGTIWALALIGGPLLHAVDHRDDHVHGPGGAIVRRPSARAVSATGRTAPAPSRPLALPTPLEAPPAVVERASGARRTPPPAVVSDRASGSELAALWPAPEAIDAGGHLHGLPVLRAHRLGADPARRPEARTVAFRPPPAPVVLRARRTTRARAPPPLAPA